MEPVGLSPCFKLPTICPSPEPWESNLYLSISILRSLLIFCYLYLGLPSGLVPSGFPHQDQCVFLFSPICTRVLFISLFDQYKSRSSSLCSFLQSPGTPSLLGPRIFIITWLSVTILPVLILNKQFILCRCTAGWDWRHGQVYCWTCSKICGPSKIGYPSNDYSFSHPVRSSVY